ncbi:MAG: DUF4321 domain-containing protein [Candidatus Ratteibacteria bacterium]|nr:DUF4321 domain-containing protein [Candidatus Ratteibacteria bacterium]
MYKVGKTLGLLLLIIIIGAILGGIVSEIIGLVIPEGKVRQFFITGPVLTLAPSTWNLIVLTITFGFHLKINICSALGIIAGVFIFRRI